MKWRQVDNKLYCQFVFKNFKEALEFVNKVGELAEKKNHHPDICICYNKVDLVLWTHETKNITDKDYKLAHLVSELVASSSSVE